MMTKDSRPPDEIIHDKKNAEVALDANGVELEEIDWESYLDAVASRFCPECGAKIEPNRMGRHKKFCTEVCRFLWKKKHPKPENWNTVSFICPTCGVEFKSRGYGNLKRKYCSHACANRGRAILRSGAKVDLSCRNKAE